MIHKNVQFQVRVRPEFIPMLLRAIEQSGLPRWEYINRVVADILGDEADIAIPESPPNRKGMVKDYWTSYRRVPFIITTEGLAALNRSRRAEGYRYLSSFLRDRLVQQVCDDLGVNPERIEPMRRKEKGMGFGYA